MDERPVPLTSRVRCTQVNRLTRRPCGAERVLGFSPTCFVCGGATFERVHPSPGDIPALYADLAGLATDLLRVDPSPAHRAILTAVARAAGGFLTSGSVREVRSS